MTNLSRGLGRLIPRIRIPLIGYSCAILNQALLSYRVSVSSILLDCCDPRNVSPMLLFPIFRVQFSCSGEGNGTPLQYSCLENPMDGGAWQAAVHGVAESWTRLSYFTFTFHFHVLEKEMATHSSVLAWRIPGTGEPGGLLSMGSHKSRTRMK